MKIRLLLLAVSFTSYFLLASAVYANQNNLTQTPKAEINHTLDELTPSPDSALEKKLQKEKDAEQNPLSITLYRPTYILPFYYTGSPYQVVYYGNTPNEQSIMHEELKAQMSVMVPIFRQLFWNPNASLGIAYTQLNYWQVYASSQYFREVNYEPEIFIQNHFRRNWLARVSLDHQSNGRGGTLERSWNRAIGTVEFSGEHWIASIKAWSLIFKSQSSNVHNPHIAHFLGYDNFLFSYQIKKATLSLEAQNIESGFSRGFVQATISYPILKHISVYVQYFNGYGQSLIEYDHRTQSAGIGIAFNDWI